MTRAHKQLLTSILRDVSRSFYLTLRVLPAGVRSQIGTAYLLARMTDTIADTGIISVQNRIAALQVLRERILGSSKKPLELGDLAKSQGSPAERVLLTRCEEALELLGSFDSEDVRLMREVLSTITSGQLLDLERFGGVSAEQIVPLENAQQLDDYTYRVAGCVGEFWTRLCRRHLFSNAVLDENDLVSKGVRFGKGLQLVNILRDLPRDVRQGRCYLPADELGAVGLQPKDLLNPECEPALRPVYNKHLAEAETHLREGWIYTCRLPYRCVRVRLACAWPLLIGFETVSLLRVRNILDTSSTVKVSRPRVRKIIASTVLTYPLPPVWRSLPPKVPAATE